MACVVHTTAGAAPSRLTVCFPLLCTPTPPLFLPPIAPQEHTPKYANIVAVVDPPRAGLHKDVLFALLTCPALKRLVYVSCNPDTLVHNCKILCGRYRPDLNAPKGEAVYVCELGVAAAASTLGSTSCVLAAVVSWLAYRAPETAGCNVQVSTAQITQPASYIFCAHGHPPCRSLSSTPCMYPAVDPRRANKRQKQQQQQPPEPPQEVPPLPPYEPLRPTRVMSFDLFPHTAHVEMVVLFERD